jgi:hypothetical protein
MGLAGRLIRLYGEYRAEFRKNEGVVGSQERILRYLLKRAQNTTFGRDHGFKEIKSVTDYQKRVPIRTYENYWEEYFKSRYPVFENLTWPGTIKYFAVSSGTSSGKTKYLPISHEMLRNNQKAALDVVIAHMLQTPRSNLFSGKCFVLGGTTGLKEEIPGVYSGDLSGIVGRCLPFWARPFYFPPPRISQIQSWEERLTNIAAELHQEKIVMMSGIPTWLLLVLQKVAEFHKVESVNLHELFPYLSLFIHGGVDFAPYREQFLKLSLGLKDLLDFREVYPASEGFIAGQDKIDADLRLNTDHGIFFEFIPLAEINSESPTRLWIGNLEVDKDYAIVLTTCSGLFSYLIGDTVQVTSLNPPRLHVTGRTSYMLSAFGEHLLGKEIEMAVSQSAINAGVTVNEFSVRPLFPSSADGIGRHQYAIELAVENSAKDSTDEEHLATLIDAELRNKNDDYASLRKKDFAMLMPKVVLLPRGTFHQWMKDRGKLGGQHKVPRVIHDQALFQSILETNPNG